MAWRFNDLHYGWKVVAGITLAAATIYVADNARRRVNQVDIIELALGVHERCLATQYETGAVYCVNPLSNVQYWSSGDVTNIYTNVFGWRTDRAMMVSLDAKIFALVTNYINTNIPYSTATNYTTWTVTGLWASLGIGDGTNQFTRVPAWVGTNGATNASTFGALPWRVYIKDLEERYKVLNALEIPYPYYSVDSAYTNIGKSGSGYAESHWVANGRGGDWTSCRDGGGTYVEVAKQRADAAYDATNVVTNAAWSPTAYGDYNGAAGVWQPDNGHWCAICTANTSYSNYSDAYANLGEEGLFHFCTVGCGLVRRSRRTAYSITIFNTNALPCFDSFVVDFTSVGVEVYDGQGDGYSEGFNSAVSNKITCATNSFVVDIGDHSLTRPDWIGPGGAGYWVSAIGHHLSFSDNPQGAFQYCVTKFW